MIPWGILITGAVGLAGIGGTLWQGKRAREAQTADLKASLDATSENLRLSLSAENERARLAEKRRIYVTCMAAIGEITNAISKLDITRDEGGGHREAVLIEHSATLTNLLNAVSEVLMVAPKSVMQLARRTYTIIVEDVLPGDNSEKDAARFRQVRDQLLMAMRADLGEPGE
jgi:hypothetical protein